MGLYTAWQFLPSPVHGCPDNGDRTGGPRGAFWPDDALKPTSPTFFWCQGLVSWQMDVSADRGLGGWFRDDSSA